jgi:hypothetical protein
MKTSADSGRVPAKTRPKLKSAAEPAKPNPAAKPRPAAKAAKPKPATKAMGAAKPKPATKAKGASSAGKPGGRAGKSTPAAGVSGVAASRLIDQRIRELASWHGQTLARMRALILEADPEFIEEVKWGGTPVWSRNGIVCTGESYKKVVKLTFARGASLADPTGLFNSSLEGNTRRAIDIQEGELVDASAFKALVRAAVALNGAPKKR